MLKTNVDINKFNAYYNIFGKAKMRSLWREYLHQSSIVWKNLHDYSKENKRLAFHNWRSSSQVFGMLAFADKCLQIEDAILHCRMQGIEEKINISQNLYKESIKEVEKILSKKE